MWVGMESFLKVNNFPYLDPSFLDFFNVYDINEIKSTIDLTRAQFKV